MPYQEHQVILQFKDFLRSDKSIIDFCERDKKKAKLVNASFFRLMARMSDFGLIDAPLQIYSVRRQPGTWLEAVGKYEAMFSAPVPTNEPYNRLLALHSLRHEVEQECAKRLASIDQMIEAETAMTIL